VGEVAVAVLLLFGAGLLLRTLFTLDGVDRGYRARGVVTMMVDPLASTYPTTAALMGFYESIEREILSGPGARSVAWTSTVPMGPSMLGTVSVDIVGDPPAAPGRRPTAASQVVSPAYFRTLDLPLVAGREFTSRDAEGAPLVCIVNDVFVRRYLDGRSPIGVRIALRSVETPNAEPSVREIVGVARYVKGRPDETEDLAQAYSPLAQFPLDDIYLLIAPAPGGGGGLAADVRAAIARVDTAQLVSVVNARTLDDVASSASGRYRFRAVLVMTFAALALLLAMVGVFGVLGYSVQQRWREFGIRRALGATTRDVMTLVASEATRLVLTGTAIGLALASASGRAISTFLFGVEPLDPATFAAVAVVLTVTAGVSAAAPAWRAARVDPAVALRN
jgi:putative ABC transport system permease protein